MSVKSSRVGKLKKIQNKVIACMLAVLMVLTSFGVDRTCIDVKAEENAIEITSWEVLKQEIETAEGNKVFVLQNDLASTSTITIPSNRDITIKGNHKTIYRALYNKRYLSMFSVERGGTLNLEDLKMSGKRVDLEIAFQPFKEDIATKKQSNKSVLIIRNRDENKEGYVTIGDDDTNLVYKKESITNLTSNSYKYTNWKRAIFDMNYYGSYVGKHKQDEYFYTLDNTAVDKRLAFEWDNNAINDYKVVSSDVYNNYQYKQPNSGTIAFTYPNNSKKEKENVKDWWLKSSYSITIQDER